MPAISEYQSLDNTIRVLLDKIAKVPTEEIVQTERLGELSFSEDKHLVYAIKDLVAQLADLDTFKLPFKTINDLIGALQSLWDSMNALKNFDINRGNPSVEKQKKSNQLHQAYADNFNLITSVISAIPEKKNDLDNLESELRAKIAENEATADKILNDLYDTLEAAQKAAGEVGIAANAKIFEQEAESFNSKSRRWLYASITSIFLTLLFLIIQAYSPPEIKSGQSGSLANFILNRLLFMSVLLYTVSFSVKNYRASNHNATVNRHRNNALLSFQVFAEATKDDVQMRNAVIMEATRSIFSNQPTGYSDRAGNSSEGSSTVIEVIKGGVQALSKSPNQYSNS